MPTGHLPIPRAVVPEIDDIGGLAFWLRPDWSGGDNLRDPGTEPFWMLPPLKPNPDRTIGEATTTRPMMYGRTRISGNFIEYGTSEMPAARPMRPTR